MIHSKTSNFFHSVFSSCHSITAFRLFQTFFSIAQISEKVNANVLIAGYKEKLEMEGILQSDPFLILVT